MLAVWCRDVRILLLNAKYCKLSVLKFVTSCSEIFRMYIVPFNALTVL